MVLHAIMVISMVQLLQNVVVGFVGKIQFQLYFQVACLDLAVLGLNWFETRVYHIQSHNGGLSEEKRKERNRLGLTSV